MNGYLVVAYGFVWGIFSLYAWILNGRERKLEREVEELKRSLGSK
jgi:CcmD family protein